MKIDNGKITIRFIGFMLVMIKTRLYERTVAACASMDTGHVIVFILCSPLALYFTLVVHFQKYKIQLYEMFGLLPIEKLYSFQVLLLVLLAKNKYKEINI